MTRQKIILLVGFPLFGFLSTSLPDWLDISSSFLDIIVYINIVPITLTYIYHLSMSGSVFGLDFYYFDTLIYFSFFVIFWVPIALLVNWGIVKYITRFKNIDFNSKTKPDI